MKNPNNILSKKRPDLVEEWHCEKNYPLTPDDVTHGSHKKVWWKCQKCGCEWMASAGNRFFEHSACPSCPTKPAKNNSLAFKFPELVSEWHPVKNGTYTPDDFTYGSHHKAWWICNKGHEWFVSINSRTNLGSSGSVHKCPSCTNRFVTIDNCLATINPKLAQQWHPTKNKGLLPSDVSGTSVEKVWWICDKGHEWKSTIYSRKEGAGCPYCSGHRMTHDNCFAVNYPELAKEWNLTKNGGLKPIDISQGSKTKVWWKCKKGHEWKASVKSRARLGSGCPKCRGYNLKNGTHFSSLLDVYFYFQLKKQKVKFSYNKVYPRIDNIRIGKKGLMRYDFYLINENKYIEVTGYDKVHCIDQEQYNAYLDNIKIKQNYVENILGAKFEFIQKILTAKEKEFIKKFIV